MGFDLKSATGHEIQWTNVYWHLMLPLAEQYGWHPAGTHPPEGVTPVEWDGSYVTNDGQLVTGEDVSALAEAIAKAIRADNLDEVANTLYVQQMREGHELAAQLIQDLTIDGEPRGLVARLRQALGLMKKEPKPMPEKPDIQRLKQSDVASALAELHKFCGHGSFRIW